MAPRDTYWVCEVCSQWTYTARAECWGCHAARPTAAQAGASAAGPSREGRRRRRSQARGRRGSSVASAAGPASAPAQECDELNDACLALRALEGMPEAARRAIPGHAELVRAARERKAAAEAARRAQLPAHEQLRKAETVRAKRKEALAVAEGELKDAIEAAERKRGMCDDARRALAEAEREVVQVQAALGQSAVSANTPLVQRLRAAAAEPNTANVPALLEELLVVLGVVPALATFVAAAADPPGGGGQGAPAMSHGAAAAGPSPQQVPGAPEAAPGRAVGVGVAEARAAGPPVAAVADTQMDPTQDVARRERAPAVHCLSRSSSRSRSGMGQSGRSRASSGATEVEFRAEQGRREARLREAARGTADIRSFLRSRG